MTRRLFGLEQDGRTVVAYDQKVYRLELSAAVAVSALVVALHVANLQNAGALWRDEVVTVSVATMPALSGLWSSVQYDSFPGLVHFVLRGWTAIEWGATDFGLRVFGCLVGLLTAAALWLSGSLFKHLFPLFSLALFAMNPVTVHYGDSIRGYGLGLFLIVLMFGLMWGVLESYSPSRAVLAGLVAVLSVQCLYQNSVLLLAICIGGLAVTIRRRDWRGVTIVVGIGSVAALSMVLNLGLVAAKQEQKLLVHSYLDMKKLLRVFSQAVSHDVWLLNWIWIVLSGLGLLAAVVYCVRRAGKHLSEQPTDVVVFSAVTMITGAVGFVIFLKILNLPTQVWYYLPIMALLAVSLDSLLSVFITTTFSRLCRVAVVALIVAIAIIPTWRAVHVRHTNVDLIASKLHETVEPGDLVLVNYWYVGATFQRYYRGPAPWTTLPPLEDHELQPVDFFKRQMTSSDPIGPVLVQIRSSLESGHRVWLVGGLPFPKDGQDVPSAPPAPHAPWGWDYDKYAVVWSMQAAHFVQEHALNVTQWSRVTETPVSDLENLPVFVVEGWRTGSEARPRLVID